MPSLKLYLLRSVYDWAIDCGFTPQVVVDAARANVMVPSAYVQDGKIVLNIHPRAVTHFALSDEALSFSARFDGQPFQVYCPLPSVLAIYARENQQGISLPESEEPTSPEPETPPPRKGPTLKVIK